MADMHPTLIRANIALFAGDYAEVRRLLADYRAEGGGAAEYAPMALWLDAHAQTDPDERLRRLEALLTVVAPESPYASMAHDILQLERPHVAPPRRGIGPRGILLTVIALFGAGLLLVSSLNRPPPPATIDAPTPTTPATAAPLPDRSRPLVAADYTVRYSGGVLQVMAAEDNAVRVVSRDGTPLQPVPGARFFAVELAFECRSAICQSPPEADIMLRLADQSLLPARESAFIQHQPALAPVALGITTRGWLVFEIPSIIAVAHLEVTAPDADGIPQTMTIPLE